MRFGPGSHPCPGCLSVTSRPARCFTCGGVTTTQRGYGADWQKRPREPTAPASLCLWKRREDDRPGGRTATDVDHVVLGFGTPEARPVERVDVGAMRDLQREHDFASGSMGPKVEAALRFVEAGGTRSVITSMENIEQAVNGRAGTVIEQRGTA